MTKNVSSIKRAESKINVTLQKRVVKDISSDKIPSKKQGLFIINQKKSPIVSNGDFRAYLKKSGSGSR
jgi:hypothetical protein